MQRIESVRVIGKGWAIMRDDGLAMRRRPRVKSIQLAGRHRHGRPRKEESATSPRRGAWF